MNKTYFIDPNASDDFREYKSLLELFGYSKGRFVVEYPKNWSAIILGYLDKLEIDGVTRMRIVEELKKKQNEMIKLNGQIEENISWIDFANKFSTEFSPSSKLIGKSTEKQIDYIIDNVLLSGLDDGATTRVTFPETIDNYRDLIRPIFGMGTEVFVADRFFQLRRINDIHLHSTRRNDIHPKSPFESLSALKNEDNITRDLNKKFPIHYDNYNFLLELVRDADRSSKTRKLIIFFEEKKFVDNFTKNDHSYLVEHDITSISKEASLKNITLEYRIIPQHAFSRTHWRLVFCTKCALHIDAGIRFSSKKLKNSATWVTPETLSDLISPYEKYFPEK